MLPCSTEAYLRSIGLLRVMEAGRPQSRHRSSKFGQVSRRASSFGSHVILRNILSMSAADFAYGAHAMMYRPRSVNLTRQCYVARLFLQMDLLFIVRVDMRARLVR